MRAVNKYPEPSFLKFLEALQVLTARAIQSRRRLLKEIRLVTGVDVAYRGDTAVAAAALWSLDERRVLRVALEAGRTPFPYVPGFLFMREAPLMAAAAQKLKGGADLLLVDGHGLSHPRRAGVAVFVGFVLDTPTLGVAKSLLMGELGKAKGIFTPILINGSTVGYMVKPKASRRYYVSPGYGIGVKDVIKTVRLMGEEYPEALREAHRAAKRGVGGVE